MKITVFPSPVSRLLSNRSFRSSVRWFRFKKGRKVEVARPDAYRKLNEMKSMKRFHKQETMENY